ncbi:conserved hypothetical protein [Ricinus communis]|uniref:Uncharacterized protein n=1 Tax=Ricinus communis TaxID=3988 RepID=B9SX02_RICCO|nr:conserved hypothetical protein [Ricinus communis]
MPINVPGRQVQSNCLLRTSCQFLSIRRHGLDESERDHTVTITPPDFEPYTLTFPGPTVTVTITITITVTAAPVHHYPTSQTYSYTSQMSITQLLHLHRLLILLADI